LEYVRAGEHLTRRAVRVRLGEGGTLRPRDEVLERAPPGLDLVVPLAVGIVRPRAVLVVELHRPRAVHLVAHEARVAIDQVDATLEAVLEVDLVPTAHGDPVRDDHHGASLARRPPRAIARAAHAAIRGLDAAPRRTPARRHDARRNGGQGR